MTILTSMLSPREPDPLIGQAPAFLDLMEQVSRAAPLDRPLLVIGERGTGKELVAQRLHFLSRRWDQRLVKLNCAALPESLLESELFGHEAGAFTGAARRRLGRFELADGGTLFLDEIANAGLPVQEKILRVIEYGEFERLGASDTQRVDVRLIAAANLDLPAAAEAGRVRHDLLDRLSFDVLTVPPLRARAEDIPRLARHFATAFAAELDRDGFAGFAEPALAALVAHPWPGNVRELKNVVERAVYRLDDPAAPIEEIVFDPFASPWRPAAPAIPSRGAPPPVSTTTRPASEPEPPRDLRAAVAALERRLIEAALAEARYNRRAAARGLGLSYEQLRGLLRKHGLPGHGRVEV